MTEGNSIREMCASLRNLLGSVKPVGMEDILQEVLELERDAARAGGDRLPAISAELMRLLARLRDEGIIDTPRWKEFVGESGPF